MRVHIPPHHGRVGSSLCLPQLTTGEATDPQYRESGGGGLPVRLTSSSVGFKTMATDSLLSLMMGQGESTVDMRKGG